jgi:hypothetical protein
LQAILTEGFPHTIAKDAKIDLSKSIAREYGSSNNIRAYSLALGNIFTLATYESMTLEDKLEALK